VEHLLPTARARDGKGPGYPDDLPSTVLLLPTPKATAEGGSLWADGTPYGTGYGLALTDAVRLLPTPRVSDGAHGGPNQRGSRGDLALPSAAHRIGAATPPPSPGGSRPPAGPPPGQLTLWDD
jgi:hypothetical protein